MQATVASFDADSESGTVLLDDGLRLSFDAAIFAGSGARMLRPGQRVFVEVDEDSAIPVLRAMWLFRPNRSPGGTAAP
jgi:2-phospho-L-lactate/phosphoenolpyruvate guanylyltransferase